jgi:8-oxo-dGTP pyrophosphatase MutT (NUDIX family)
MSQKYNLLPVQTNGIACIRYEEIPQFLFVRRRLTYAFDNFVRGMYQADIADQISKMTLEERLDISTCDFIHIWYRMYRQNPTFAVTRSEYKSNFEKCRSIFERRFMQDGGLALRKLISDSKLSPQNLSYLWEMPKGYPKKYEARAYCAVREFIEETQIPRSHFRLIPDQVKFYNYKGDNLTMYITHYYAAICKPNTDISIALKNCHEISDIRWMTLKEIKIQAPHFYDLCASILKSIKHRRKLDMQYVNPWEVN